MGMGDFLSEVAKRGEKSQKQDIKAVKETVNKFREDAKDFRDKCGKILYEAVRHPGKTGEFFAGFFKEKVKQYGRELKQNYADIRDEAIEDGKKKYNSFSERMGALYKAGHERVLTPILSKVQETGKSCKEWTETRKDQTYEYFQSEWARTKNNHETRMVHIARGIEGLKIVPQKMEQSLFGSVYSFVAERHQQQQWKIESYQAQDMALRAKAAELRAIGQGLQ